MALVAGVDSSTQSCKVVIHDADSGELIRSGRAPHPDGTSVDPREWWSALGSAIESAGGLSDVAAISIAGQQHGMVCLDESGSVVRDALLWNDTRSAPDAERLIAELGEGDQTVGAQRFAEAVGSRPVASFTITKLAWLAHAEPEHLAATRAVALPHDYLTWGLLGGAPGVAALEALVTDRGDASGTGYWSSGEGRYRTDLLKLATGRDDLIVPTVIGPNASAGVAKAFGSNAIVGPGTGDNAGSALGVGAVPGDVIVSIGTSGTVFAVSATPTADPTGTVAGFADATGNFLPLVCTLNAARVLEAAAAMTGTDFAGLDALALSAAPGAEGVVVLPYLEGERTPNRPRAKGSIHGLTPRNATAANIARASIEGLLCGLADGLDALREEGVAVRRVLLVGGGAKSEALRQIAPAIFAVPVQVPPPGEYVAVGAARQAAWTLSGATTAPEWAGPSATTYEAAATTDVRARYAEVRDLTVD